jgi:hypothetical protein
MFERNGHTLGPWYMTYPPYFGQYHVYSNNSVNGNPCIDGRQAICSIPYEGKKGAVAYHEMFKANAKLIISAPELYDIAVELVSLTDTIGERCRDSQEVNELIRKTTDLLNKFQNEDAWRSRNERE